MPASSALSTGVLKAVLSTTARASPSALPLIAVFVALTISATTELAEPVHWNEQPRSLHASSAPYWVGVKNGLVVTWLTKTNFQFGVFGKLPTAPATAVWSSAQAASSPVAASDALASPVPASRRRRVTLLLGSWSAARATAESTLRMVHPPRCQR